MTTSCTTSAETLAAKQPALYDEHFTALNYLVKAAERD